MSLTRALYDLYLPGYGRFPDCIATYYSTCILIVSYGIPEFGFGKSTMGSIIEEEASEAIERLKLNNGKDVLIDQNFNIAIFNILWRIVANKRYNVCE
jgi:hypothetical protein